LSAGAANAVGYALGLMVSFALNRRWTFRDRMADGALPRWLATAAVAYLANLLVVLALVRSGWANAYWAQPIGVAPYTLLMFVGSRVFVFPAAPSREAYR
ncbi:MAG TPA: GtrA family protein, partial [Beijerinckiaceae bacterium]